MFFVVNATKSIARGSIIRRDDVEVQESAIAPSRGALTNIAEAADRVAVRNIGKSEVLSDANTAADIKGVSLSELIPFGLRAVALRVTEESAVANLIRPGDKVDVLLLSNAARAATQGTGLFPPAEALTILQNVPVLAVGEATIAGGANAGAARNVTLAVTPQQAAKVALLRSVGGEYLSLRAGNDDTASDLSTVSTNDLVPNRPVERRAAPPPARRPADRVVEIIGGKSDNVSRVRLEDGK